MNKENTYLFGKAHFLLQQNYPETIHFMIRPEGLKIITARLYFFSYAAYSIDDRLIIMVSVDSSSRAFFFFQEIIAL